MEKNKLVYGEKLSKEKFFRPSREFGIMPFWFWNGEMSYEEMEYQLREYYDKGIPGLYIHARFGIRDYMPYLGEEWFNRVKFTIEKAQEIGLQVWVYDEYNWPSGTAGNEVQQRDPDLTEVYLQLVEGDLPGQFFTFMEGTDSRYNDLEQSEPVYACAIKLEDIEKGNFEYVDLMPSLSFDKVITWEAPKGPWKQFYFIERKASWYADVLNPETTKKFLEYTHERYKAAQGGKLGNGHMQECWGTRGFYTDEPAMLYFEAGKDNYVIPWSRKMFKIFKERNGYDLKKHLPKLFFHIGQDTEKIRYDFWHTLSEQYDDAYYKQIGDWCNENEVVFTGHLLHEESLRMHAKSGGNLFKHLSHMNMTGVDHLYPRIGTREMPNEHVALKIASSASHQFGSTRLLCESMGGSYWDCTMERMKWIADWEYVLGVNIFNPHGYHYSIEGERKRDWPPSQFYHHTWWKQYKLFNDYVTRMGYLLTGGNHVAKVAVLYPMNTIWSNFTPQKRDKISNVVENDFTYMTDRLLRLHIDFDYLDEDVMKDCEIRGGKLCIKGEQYEMLMLPPCTHIQKSTMDILERFHQSGGKIGGDALLPYRYVDSGREDYGTPELARRVEALFGKDPVKLREEFLSADRKGVSLEVRDDNAGGRVVFLTGQGIEQEDALDALRSAMLACVTPEIEISSDEVFYLHRVKDGRDFFFLCNPVAQGGSVQVALQGEWQPELWNLEDGSISPLYVYQVKDGKTLFTLDMQPYGSAMISAAEKPAALYAEASEIHIDGVEDGLVKGYARLEQNSVVTLHTPEGRKERTLQAVKPLPAIQLGGVWQFETDKPNALLTDKWKVCYAEEGYDPAKGDETDYSGWMDFRMGAWEMQLPEERDEAVYPVDLWYVTDFAADYLPEDLRLMIDGFKGAKYELYVNGRQVTELPVRSYLDAEIKEVPLNRYARRGINLVAVKLTVRKKSDGMVDLLKIIGSFSVGQRDGRDVILPPVSTLEMGDWVTMGLPYYSGTGSYTQEVEIGEEYMGKELFLKADVGTDVLEVYVNGQLIKTCLWNPYTANLTGALKSGKNKITLKVVNTLINLLEGTRNRSGLFHAEIVPFDRYQTEA